MEVSCSDVRTLQLNIEADTSLKRETCTKFSPIVSSSSQIYYSRDEHILFMRQVGIMWKYEDNLRCPLQVSLATWTIKCDHDESVWWNTKGVCVKENWDNLQPIHARTTQHQFVTEWCNRGFGYLGRFHSHAWFEPWLQLCALSPTTRPTAVMQRPCIKSGLPCNLQTETKHKREEFRLVVKGHMRQETTISRLFCVLNMFMIISAWNNIREQGI